ncbi:hypothetical protein D187_001462 [Cystobacter fuscus DSM 2262]|uniref:Uncharacterized protein n=1 Tax=Cystobacter fuscus (strain ATCC 25194 / DSM 2262 / NBRC 100088 / M29) TaxID=1242864 RepID=S9QVW2_CYSF2|nr:hypothetical protein D187_001462 [Cystobacter fuscus DSM 2262]
MSCAVVLGASGCTKRKQSEETETIQTPLAVKEAPGAAHRAGWVKALATSDSCVPETSSNYKGVCLAAAAFGDARRGQAPTQTVRLWGMTFRERYKGAELLQQNILLAAIELSPTVDGGLRVTLFEQWPESESDIDYLGSASEQLDHHHFRGQGEPPEPRWLGRLWTGLGREEGPRRAQLQPTAQGYAGGEPLLELRAFPKGWMVATEGQDAEAGEETRVFGVFVPPPKWR